MGAMSQVFVESWDPSYGTPLSPDDELAPTEGQVRTDVEVEVWSEPLPGVDDGVERVAFVDGIRRVEARLTVESDTGRPISGICGAYGVGATVWDRIERHSTFSHELIERISVTGGGELHQLPPAGVASFTAASVTGLDPADLIQYFHGEMRRAEGKLIAQLSDEGLFVVGDGPVNDTRPRDVVGFIKTHRVSYLEGDESELIGRLRPGFRTPLFVIGATGNFARYTWYQRLADSEFGHDWYGVVRCEVSASLGLADAQRLADRTAALLPGLAAEPHIDPRAPQNLVPIGALEKYLRHLLGDQGLVYRSLRKAVHLGAAS